MSGFILAQPGGGSYLGGTDTLAGGLPNAPTSAPDTKRNPNVGTTSPLFEIWQNDTLPRLEGTLTDDNGLPLPLPAGTTVTLTVYRADSTTLLSRLAAVADQTSHPGAVNYTWQPDDTQTPGEYTALLQATFPDGNKQTFPSTTPIPLVILERNPAPAGLLITPDAMLSSAYANTVRTYQREGIDLDRIVIRATRACETRTNRRLAPFTLTESHRAEGVDPDEYASLTSGMPLDLLGSLGRSKAQAYGVSTLIRHIWLDQYAPLYPDLWTYSNVSAALARSYGDTETVPGTAIEGPEPDTGHLRFRLGTFLPPATTVRITYSGGYTTVPPDLEEAGLLTAIRMLILEAQPAAAGQGRIDLTELDTQVATLLAPYARA